jgi:hypothetical protein
MHFSPSLIVPAKRSLARVTLRSVRKFRDSEVGEKGASEGESRCSARERRQLRAPCGPAALRSIALNR